MNTLYQILGWPLGWVMKLCYFLVQNYGLALLIFTVLMRLVVFPLSIKQQKSSTRMVTMRPQIEELQKRYKNNKEKLNEEMMKLYQQEGYNPMAGCLPMLIQMPILFGVIDVVYRPLYHILRLSSETIAVGERILTELTGTEVRSGLNMAQLQIINGVQNNPEAYAEMGADVIAQIQTLNLSFFGIDLTQVPGEYFSSFFTAFNPVVLIPILSGLSALGMSIVSMKMSSATMDSTAGAGGSMKVMMLMMPLFSAWIAFSVAAGVGLYWCYSSLIAMVQSIVMNKLYNPKEMAEKAKEEFEARREKERQERIEARKNAKKGEAEDAEKALTQKEINRRKLAEARLRDAEKYGEAYVEVTDEDLV